MIDLPSRERCLAMLEDAGCEDAVIAHCIAVEMLAVEVAEVILRASDAPLREEGARALVVVAGDSPAWPAKARPADRKKIAAAASRVLSETTDEDLRDGLSALLSSVKAGR